MNQKQTDSDDLKQAHDQVQQELEKFMALAALRKRLMLEQIDLLEEEIKRLKSSLQEIDI